LAVIFGLGTKPNQSWPWLEPRGIKKPDLTGLSSTIHNDEATPTPVYQAQWQLTTGVWQTAAQ